MNMSRMYKNRIRFNVGTEEMIALVKDLLGLEFEQTWERKTPFSRLQITSRADREAVQKAIHDWLNERRPNS